MKNRIVFSVVLLLLVSSVSAQRWQAMRPKTKAQHRHGASEKIAEHRDHPEAYWILGWDTTSANWDSLFQYIVTYLPNGDVAEEVSYQYMSSAFVPNHRSVYTYNFQPMADRELYYTWNGSAWDNARKAESFYDVQGNYVEGVEYFWNGASYDTSYAERYTYVYAFTNRIAEETHEIWSNSSHLYENDARQVSHFPTAAGWDSTTYYGWDGSNWIEDFRYVDAVWYDFDRFLAYSARVQGWTSPGWEDSERLTGTFGTWDSPTYLYEGWNGATWDTTGKEINVIDSLEHQTLLESYTWAPGWVLGYGQRSDYVYDGQGHTLQTTDSYSDFLNYLPYRRYVYAQFFMHATQPTLPVTSVTAFPNPCTNQLNFKLELQQSSPVQIALYDLQGRLRMQTSAPRLVDSQVTMPISEVLENGTYVYRVSTKEGVAEGKVVVQR